MMKRLILVLIIFSIAKFSFAQGLSFGTPRVLHLHPIPCLNGGFMIWIQSPFPSIIPPGPYYVPIGSNRYMNFIFPPFPGTKMLGWYIPGGVCIQPGFPSPIPVYTIGTVTGYGSALGF